LLAGDAASVAPQHGRLQLRTPAFDTCRIVLFCRHSLSGTTPAPYNLRDRDDFTPPQKAETKGEP